LCGSASCVPALRKDLLPLFSAYPEVWYYFMTADSIVAPFIAFHNIGITRSTEIQVCNAICCLSVLEFPCGRPILISWYNTAGKRSAIFNADGLVIQIERGSCQEAVFADLPVCYDEHTVICRVLLSTQGNSFDLGSGGAEGS